MKAAQYTQYSHDFNEIKFVTIDKPSLVDKPGCALIKVYSASINPADSKIFNGGVPFPVTLPMIPGYDISGVIEQVSADVSDFSVGDSVATCHWGFTTHGDEFGSAAAGFAEYIVVPVGYLAKKPDGVSHDQAAAVAMVGMTASVFLKRADVSAGTRVLVLGGSSAVGSTLIQLAKLRGAYVATTASSRAHNYVSQFGADHIINYNEQNWWDVAQTGLSGFDVLIDTVGEAGVWAHAQTEGLIKQGGVFITAASYEAGFDPSAHQPRFAIASFISACTPGVAAIMTEVLSLIEQGKLKVVIEDVYAFNQQGVVAIFEKIGAGKSLGKNVLKIVA